jgi:AraC-like DNA-binding protein
MDGSEHQSSYREYAPGSPLKEQLVCLWTQSVSATGHVSQPVYPDTCIDILFFNNAAPIVVGPWTQPFTAQLTPGTCIVGARLRPGAALLFDLPAAQLLNRAVPLADVWGRRRTANIERLNELHDPGERCSALEGTLLRALSGRGVDLSVLDGLRWLARNPNGSVEQLSARLGMSARQIQRRFGSSVGYGPKMFQSVLRFQRLLHMLGRASPPRNLAYVAADAGYSDQAHMTREVQRFSGKSPSTLFAAARSALEMSELVDIHLPSMR